MHMQPGYKCPSQLYSRKGGVLKESNSFYFTPFIHRLYLLSERTDEILDYKFSNSINCLLISRSGSYTMLPFTWQVKDEM